MKKRAKLLAGLLISTSLLTSNISYAAKPMEENVTQTVEATYSFDAQEQATAAENDVPQKEEQDTAEEEASEDINEDMTTDEGSSETKRVEENPDIEEQMIEASKKVTNGWIEDENGKKYYADANGVLYRNQIITFGDTWYYMGADGSVQHGIVNANGRYYYADSDTGIIRKESGWLKYNGKKYYVMPDKTLRVGWLSFGSTYYYCGNDAAIVYGKQKIGNNWYYFNEEGVRQSNRWIEEDEAKYYAMPDSTLRVGWLSFGSTYYYCGNDAAVVRGKHKIGNNWYYFNEKGIRQSNRWIKEDGKKYYAMPDSTLRVGWLSFGSTYYYCGNDAAVIMNDSYVVNGIGYYFNEDGIRTKLETGWKDINGKRSYAMPDGTLRVGWLSFGSTYYYCGNDAGIVYGKQKIGNNWYYFNEKGIRQSNRWIEHGNKKSYAMPDGTLRVGWLSFGSTYYYCDSNADLVQGQKDYIIQGIKYTFDAKGIMQKESGWGEYNGNKYYKNPATGFPYTNQWVTFGSTYYYAGSNGHMVSGWQTIGGYRYYFYSDTKTMARNTTIDGVQIGADGRIKKEFADLMSIFSTVSTNTANGTYNMTKALKNFNQVVIKPGQTISFFAIAGPCGAAQGYLPAGVVGGTGYGGGICQASTTLYGAFLRAGLTVVERRNHSVPSTYVPLGQDAMVNYGTSDLKIRNDYNFPVKIVTYVKNKTLYVEIWGEKVNWYDYIKIDSWKTGSNSAVAYRYYIKNGATVKTEKLPSSYYAKGSVY